MAIIRRIDYSPTLKITAQKLDITGEFLWVAYEQNNSGNCIINKVDSFNPSDIYISLTKSVIQVNKLDINATHLFTAYDDDTLFGEIISLTSPFSIPTQISIPGGVNEAPIDIKISDTYIYFLTPGIASGENAKIVRYLIDGTYDTIIDLTNTNDTVYNANSMTIASPNEIWVSTNETPSNIVRVYQEILYT
jgi:hypothetical protein